MNIPQSLRKRINFQGDFDDLFTDVAKAYKLGDYISFDPIELGYEDFNVKLNTSGGVHFVKIFADKREESECLRLINIVISAIDSGVSHPKFLKKEFGYIFKERYEDFNIRLAVFEYLEGKTYFELKRNPNVSELKEIIRMASLVNKIQYKPAPLYDSWAIVNFIEEFKKTKKYFSEKELKALEKLLAEFEKVNLKSLPQTLVHGDLVSTNIMNIKKEIYFVDFSVANFYPRIVELAVLMSDVMYDPKGATSIEKYHKLLVTEYQKHQKLTEDELKTLPLFIKIAHAMNLIGATYEREKKKNKSMENDSFLEKGKKGLHETSKVFK